MVEVAYIGLGSNIGDRLAVLHLALADLADHDGITLVAASGAWETSPVGGGAQEDYLNAAASVSTELTPRQLLDTLLAIEREHGRQRLVRWGPRTLDLDLLLYADHQVDEPGLTVPHPWLERRRFVLEPLIEIAPDLTHPSSGHRLADVLHDLQQQQQEQACRVAALDVPWDGFGR